MSLTASGISVEDLLKIRDDVMGYDLRSAFDIIVPAGMPEDGEDSDEEEDDTDEGDEETDASGSGSSGSGSDDIKDPDRKRLSEEAKRHRLAAKQEKKRADDLAARLKEIEDKDKSETERLQSELEETKSRAERAEATVHRLALKSAFGIKHGSKFRDAEDALALLGTDFEIDEDGNVEGLDEAVEDLLKRKPYLAVAEDVDEDNDDDESTATTSGRSVNGKKKPQKDVDREALLKKYPALRR